MKEGVGVLALFCEEEGVYGAVGVCYCCTYCFLAEVRIRKRDGAVRRSWEKGVEEALIKGCSCTRGTRLRRARAQVSIGRLPRLVEFLGRVAVRA